MLTEKFVPFLRCPKSLSKLNLDKNRLIAHNQLNAYQVDSNGIALFATNPVSEDAIVQQNHYDKIFKSYAENLDYPHTKIYINYLDNTLSDIVNLEPLGITAEICCGTGEAFSLYKSYIDIGIGVDISSQMLTIASKKFTDNHLAFVQGDATNLPLQNEMFDTVIMLGGVHHVNNRECLFKEISRILKPGGRFIWREPVSDFWIWLLLRSIIYRISPMLDHATEKPLRYSETYPHLLTANLNLEHWKTVGYIGFCLFMNSDVLYFNRLFRFIPCINLITKIFTKIDSIISMFPALSRLGLIVIGQARKSIHK
jgi:ubiquinone/menaquinone biosynthesis C-methylase UbiE